MGTTFLNGYMYKTPTKCVRCFCYNCVIVGRCYWMIAKERMEQLEPWEVSLGGEHYLFPELHYFMNISMNNLISLCAPSSPVLPCIHCCLGSPSLRAISRVRRDFPVAWGENLFRTGKSSVINYFPKTCWSANHTGAAGTWVKHIINKHF